MSNRVVMIKLTVSRIELKENKTRLQISQVVVSLKTYNRSRSSSGKRCKSSLVESSVHRTFC